MCKVRFEAVRWRSKHNTPVSGTGTGRITRTRTRLQGKPIKLKIHRPGDTGYDVHKNARAIACFVCHLNIV